jgi:DNA-binding transcriptional ArsR family regulator
LTSPGTIEYRRLSIDMIVSARENNLDRTTAEAYAHAFRSLADATRIIILNCLARAQEPLSVGELVEQVDVGQSTVSHHLRILLDGGFVQVRHVGTLSLFEVNADCLDCLPATAAAILNLAVASSDDCGTCSTVDSSAELVHVGSAAAVEVPDHSERRASAGSPPSASTEAALRAWRRRWRKS